MGLSITNSNFPAIIKTGRERAFETLSRQYRGANGQFFTPYPIAEFMASLAEYGSHVRLLDAGAGVGALTLATVEAAIASRSTRSIEVVCFEKEPQFQRVLCDNLNACARYCESQEIAFTSTIIADDFIMSASAEISGTDLFRRCSLGSFSHSVLNPPYKKLRSDSDHRRALRFAGIETSNLYTAFVWLALRLLGDYGQLTAITPRSFCNGLYFRPFRQFLRDQMEFRHIHSIEQRRTAFSDDDVLQENIIFHGIKSSDFRTAVTLSKGDGISVSSRRSAPHNDVVEQSRDAMIHLALSEEEASIVRGIESLPCLLEDLEVSVSTGPVVDFRLKEYLRKNPELDSCPLLYPCHFNGNSVDWPKPGHKKPNSIKIDGAVRPSLLPVGHYVLVKRFTSKEQIRRVVAVVLSPEDLPGKTQMVGIENHINYFHSDRNPLGMELAWGLSAYLNSSFVDAYLRVFNGHTQVNATDLRKLRYPAQIDLIRLGREILVHREVDLEAIDLTLSQLIFQNRQVVALEIA